MTRVMVLFFTKGLIMQITDIFGLNAYVSPTSWDVLVDFCTTQPGKISDNFPLQNLTEIDAQKKEQLLEKIQKVFERIISTKDWSVFSHLFSKKNILSQLPYKLLHRTLKAYCTGRPCFKDPYREFSEKLLQLHKSHSAIDHLQAGMALYASGKVKGNIGSDYLAYQAAMQGEVGYLQTLLADPMVNPFNRFDSFYRLRENVIQHACDQEQYDILKLLINDARIKIEEEGFEALLKAIEFGQTKVVEILLSCPRIDVNAPYYFLTPLGMTIKHSRLQEFKMLLAHPKIKISSYFLFLASRHNALEMLQLLLKQEWIVEDLFSNPLCSLKDDDQKAVKILLEDGRFDPLGTIWGNSAYYQALKNNQKEVIQLLETDARVQAFKSNYGNAEKGFIIYWNEIIAQQFDQDLKNPCVRLDCHSISSACESPTFSYQLERMLATDRLIIDHPFIPLFKAKEHRNGEALQKLLQDGRFDPLGTHESNSLYFSVLDDQQEDLLAILEADSRIVAFKKTYGTEPISFSQYWKDQAPRPQDPLEEQPPHYGICALF